MLNLLAILLAVIGTIIGAFGSLYLKKGAKNFNFKIRTQLKNKNLLLGIFLFVFGTLFYLYALKLERLSLIYPLTSLTYVWVALLSIKFLGEKMNSKKWLGILLIIIGIILISYFS